MPRQSGALQVWTARQRSGSVEVRQTRLMDLQGHDVQTMHKQTPASKSQSRLHLKAQPDRPHGSAARGAALSPDQRQRRSQEPPAAAGPPPPLQGQLQRPANNTNTHEELALPTEPRAWALATLSKDLATCRLTSTLAFERRHLIPTTLALEPPTLRRKARLSRTSVTLKCPYPPSTPFTLASCWSQ